MNFTINTQTKLNIVGLFRLLLLLMTSISLFAGIKKTSNRLSGSSDIINQSLFINDVTLSSSHSFIDKHHAVYIKFGHESNNPITNTTYTLKGMITSYTMLLNGTIEEEEDLGLVELELNINQSNMIDLSTYKVDETYGLRLSNIEVYKDGVLLNSSSPDIPALYVSLELDIERIYRMNPVNPFMIPVISTTYDTELNELITHWSRFHGAEYYELEWVFYDSYKLDGPDGVTNYTYNQMIQGINGIPEDPFINGATRVDVRGLEYSIPLIYPQGVLFCRVRPIGLTGDDIDQRAEGKWSAFTYYEIDESQSHQENLNWQYSVTFAENGMRAEEMVYFDGSYKERQKLTRDNSTLNTLVGGNLYDYHGRVGLRIPTVPTLSKNLNYLPDMALKSPTEPYTWKDFDLKIDPCQTNSYEAVGQPLDENSYVLQYHSANTNFTGHNRNYVPQADPYPYIHNVYTQDQTGRVAISGGLTEQFQPGEERSTQIIYLPVFQEELNRIFGSEAANAAFFTKEMTLDPNGQKSYQIKDYKGRVVATALSGFEPSNLLSLDGFKGEIDNIDLLNKDDALDPDDGLDNNQYLLGLSHEFHYNGSFYVDEDNQTRRLSYRINPEGPIQVSNFTNYFTTETPLQPSDFSDPYSIIFDASLKVYNDCGEIVLDEFIDSVDVHNPTEPYVLTNLANGLYTVEKKMIVHNLSEVYLNSFLQEVTSFNGSDTDDSPFFDFDDFSVEYNSMGCFPDCESNLNLTLADNPDLSLQAQYELVEYCTVIDNCEGYKVQFLDQVQPGAEFGATNSGQDNWALSVFNPNNSSVLSNLASLNLVDYSENLILTTEQLFEHWQEDWAVYFITDHPNFCIYENCMLENPYATINSVRYSSNAFKDSLAILKTDQLSEFSIQGTKNLEFNTNLPGYLGSVSYTINEYFTYDLATLLTSTTPEEILVDIDPMFVETGTTSGFKSFLQSGNSSDILQGSSLHEFAQGNSFCLNWHGNDIATCIYERDANWASGLPESIYQNLTERYWNSLKATYLTVRDEYIAEALNLGIDLSCDYSSINSLNTQIPTSNDGTINTEALQSSANNIYMALTGLCPVNEEASAFVYALLKNLTETGQSFPIDLIDGYGTSLYSVLSGQSDPSTTNFENLSIEMNFQSENMNKYSIQYGTEVIAMIINTGSIDFSLSKVHSTLTTIPDNNQVSYSLPSLEPLNLSVKIKYDYSDNPDEELLISDALLVKFNPVGLTGWNPSLFLNCFEDYELNSSVSCLRTFSPVVQDCAQAYQDYLSIRALFENNFSLNEELSIYEFCLSDLNAVMPKYKQLWDFILTTIPQTFGLTTSETMAFAQNQFLNIEDFADMEDLLYHVNSIADADIYYQGYLSYLFNQLSSNVPLNSLLSLHDHLYEIPYGKYPCLPQNFYYPEIPMDIDTSPNPCEDYNTAMDMLSETYQTENYITYLNLIEQEFLHAYAASLKLIVEQLEMEMRVSDYQYTLYYYDQSGLLVKTVPPNGVKTLTSEQFADTDTYDTDLDDPYDYCYNYTLDTTISNLEDAQDLINQDTDPESWWTPKRILESTYKYNSYNQLTEQETPDGGRVKFVYNNLGDLLKSTNEKQAAEDTYTNYIYDAQRRLTHSGEYEANDQWRSLSKTIYDKPLHFSINDLFGSLGQENLRGRVASILYYEKQAGIDVDDDYYYNSNYSNALNVSHYSYDVHGNVKTLIQSFTYFNNKKLHKRIDYTYDLISGNVKEVAYQTGKADQFYHRYYYDANNRLQEVETSSDHWNWERQAKYFYYEHGPLARVELGNEAQGQDYAYTIQGWLKAINGTGTQDDDGASGIHSFFEPDAFALELDYFSGDYTAIGGNSFLSNETIPSNRSLYNGNIASKYSKLPTADQNALVKQTYRYDQLNRIKEMEAQSSSTAIATSNYSYDASGNLQNLNRSSLSANSMMQFDDLAYHYLPGKNQLKAVVDASNTNISVDIIGSSNYNYDVLGNLISDSEAQIETVEWTAQNKVKEIKRETGSTHNDLAFIYDALGNRQTKIVKPRDNNGNLMTNPKDWEYLFYIRDASGNIMATYNQNIIETTTNSFDISINLISQDVYGSQRIGSRSIDTLVHKRRHYYHPNDALGPYGIPLPPFLASQNQDPTFNDTTYSRINSKQSYELTDHLGNVMVTLSDYSLLKSYQDYYPFGMQMPGRIFSSENYRYGFNGQEKVDEISGQGNHTTATFWEYDTRIGRRWNQDPKPNPSISNYATFANNPIWFSDALGDTVRFSNSATEDVVKNYINKDHKSYNSDFASKYRELDESQDIFTYNQIDGKGGSLDYDGESILINFGSEKQSPNLSIGSVIFEETEHAVQSLYGEIGFLQTDGGDFISLGLDQVDEGNGFVFGSKESGNFNTGRIKRLNKAINSGDIRKIISISSSRNQHYQELPMGPNSAIGDAYEKFGLTKSNIGNRKHFIKPFKARETPIIKLLK